MDPAAARRPETGPEAGATDERGATLRRRTLLGGGAGVLGAGAVALGVQWDSRSGDDGGDDGGDAAATGTLAVRLVEMAAARGDWTVWQVRYSGVAEGEEPPYLYTPDVQRARHEALEAKKAERAWTAEDPLVVLDPYGTTHTGLYVWFEDSTSGSLSFRVTAPATPELVRTAANHAQTGFAGLVIGMVPGMLCTVRLSWQPQGGSAVEGELLVHAPYSSSGYGTRLAAEVVDRDALTPGLFAMSGIAAAGDSTYLVDVDGVFRGEVTSLSPQHRFVVDEGRLVVATLANRVSVLDHLGHVVASADLGTQKIHHDVIVRGDVAYALTSQTQSSRAEDRVVRIDLVSGQVDEVVDLQALLPEYERLAHPYAEGNPDGEVGKDWIHVNSIDVAGGVMYLSGRETSTVLALDDALEPGGSPSVRWMVGVRSLWAGTGYSELFLEPVGDLIGNAGQHTVTRIDDPALPDGQYYLEMFNNNYWMLGTRDEEVWVDAGPAGSSSDDLVGTSQVLRYVVDEQAGTFTQDAAIEVPYSSVVSNVFRLGDGGVGAPMVVNSGKAGEFSERAADGTVLARYGFPKIQLGYRVYKDTFEGFWFEG